MIISSYNDSTALNQSRLKEILKSPRHFQLYKSGYETRSMGFGSLIHLAILETKKAKEVIKLKPTHVYELRKGAKIENVSLTEFTGCEKVEFNSRSTRHTAVLSDSFTWISEDDFEALNLISDQIAKNDNLCTLLANTKKEVAQYKNILDVDCKGRLDGLNDDFVLEVKTTDSFYGFEKSVVKYGYDFQAAFYQMLSGVNRTEMIMIENKHPYTVMTATMSEDFIEIGKRKVARALNLYKKCREENKWDHPTHKVLTPPSWYVAEEGDFK